MLWALAYWNARKSFFVLRRRRGVCPCHNPSDSGVPMRTGCEAIAGWNEPGRFRRVCPLLVSNSQGGWVCSVAASEVRPFWGRAIGVVGIAALLLTLTAGLGTFFFMRAVGYEVTARQVFWPAAWPELRDARVKLFVEQARAHFAQGRIREVMQALSTARLIDPHNYETGMLLAQFYEAGDPGFADVLYGQLLENHPAQRPEIARRWFRSLLARGRLERVSQLAREQLAGSPHAEMAVWTHALIFSAEKAGRPEWLESATDDRAWPLPVRETTAFAARLLREKNVAARNTLLRQTPLVADFPYERRFRIEHLLSAGLPGDALQLLAVSRQELGDRDFARLTLATYATMGDRARVTREFTALLAPARKLSPAELNLLAVHLIRYPSPELLGAAVDAMERIRTEEVEARLEAYLALYCAAGTQKDAARLKMIGNRISQNLGKDLSFLVNLEKFFINPRFQLPLSRILPEVRPLSLEITYELSDRYLSLNFGVK
ncbi:tetratricopeptide repeat protein [Oleiharenicola lentus]|uniref:tetratricopeptide repeat protein n=1 Tax=Oleiharenicola lentus TaxID=2508720 RepID=UPI003F6767CA